MRRGVGAVFGQPKDRGLQATSRLGLARLAAWMGVDMTLATLLVPFGGGGRRREELLVCTRM